MPLASKSGPDWGVLLLWFWVLPSNDHPCTGGIFPSSSSQAQPLSRQNSVCFWTHSVRPSLCLQSLRQEQTKPAANWKMLFPKCKLDRYVEILTSTRLEFGRLLKMMKFNYHRTCLGVLLRSRRCLDGQKHKLYNVMCRAHKICFSCIPFNKVMLIHKTYLHNLCPIGSNYLGSMSWPIFSACYPIVNPMFLRALCNPWEFCSLALVT